MLNFIFESSKPFDDCDPTANISATYSNDRFAPNQIIAGAAADAQKQMARTHR